MSDNNIPNRPSRQPTSIFTYIKLVILIGLLGAACYFTLPPIAHKLMEMAGWYDEENQ